MRNDKRSIRYRLIISVTGLVICVFALVLLAFNVLMSNYIEDNATEVLNQSRDFFLNGTTDPGKTLKTPGGNAEMIVLSEEYSLIFPDRIPLDFTGESDMEDFIAGMKYQGVSFGSSDIERIETDSGLYYYISAENQGYLGGYVVFFINMTNLYLFQRNLSMILMIVLLIAVLGTAVFTYFIAMRITEPIKILSKHAKKIGEGKYERIDEDFKDLELDQMKKTLNESTKKLEKYDKEQRTFFQNVSHELRTPLQIIKNNAEGINYGLLNQDLASKVILEETDRLGELVEDMIYLSRLESGSNDMSYTKNDIRETLSYTAERFRQVFQRKNIEIVYDFDDDPVFFEYEEKSLERAFVNLISNAIRYTKDRITITCREIEGRIMICIEDNGNGIDKQELPNIFNRFYKGKKGGHGIGLSIVQSIIQSYEGRIEVQTGEGGTKFTIFFDKS